MYRNFRAAALALAVAQVAAAAANAQGVGLSPVRSLFLPNPTIGNTGPQEGDIFGFALAAGDFDGDGRDDLAVGVPFDSGLVDDPVPQSGAVVVYFGAAGGTLDSSSPRRLAQQTGSGLEAGDLHGYGLASCDVDGDGFDDLAVGAPEEDLGAIVDAGAVFVYPGGPSGPFLDEFFLMTQDTVGVPEGAEAGDSFGLTIACGDFDDDGFDDLAIGAPGETIDGAQFAGWVVAIPGSSAGPDPAGSFGFSQLELPGTPETSDEFGIALAAGDWNNDGYDDLVIGVPGEDTGSGAAHAMFGGPSGLTPAGSVVLDDGVLGAFVEEDDRFGSALAFGNFDGDATVDLVVGVPSEDFPVQGGGSIDDAGQVVVAYGGSGIPTLGLVQHFSENTLQGNAEEDDAFGRAIAAGDFDGDGFDELAIGHPGDDIAVGAATVVGGTDAGLVATRRRRFVPGEAGVPGDPPGIGQGNFAYALAAGDFDGDGFDDLGVGLPIESLDGIQFAGAAAVLRGALFADGFESGDTVHWNPFPE